MKKNRHSKIIAALIFVVFWIGYFIYYEVSFTKELRSIVTSESFEFSGTVVSLHVMDGARGKILLNHVKGEDYDPRDRLAYYSCVIRNDSAELYGGGLNFIEIGDSLRVDNSTKTMYVYRNGQEVLDYPIIVNWIPFTSEEKLELNAISPRQK
ncbi:MAG: L,D-transpeptidase [Cryomorphaceae bacterium]